MLKSTLIVIGFALMLSGCALVPLVPFAVMGDVVATGGKTVDAGWQAACDAIDGKRLPNGDCEKDILR